MSINNKPDVAYVVVEAIDVVVVWTIDVVVVWTIEVVLVTIVGR